MDDSAAYVRQKTWFVWGNVLAWTVSVPLVIGLFNSFKGISEHKATGLGALAGSIAEVYVIFGVIVTFVLPLGALVLLVKSFAAVHGMRALLSVLSMCLSVLILTLAGVFAWLFFILQHRVR